MAQINEYNWPSTTADSQRWIKNTIFNLWLVKFTDKRTDGMFIEKKLWISRPEQFKHMLFKGHHFRQ